MSKTIVLILTILILALMNWIASLFFVGSFIDSSIPFALVAIAILYIFTNKNNTASRHMDMQIQGHTGIRMATSQRVGGQSLIFIGAVVYFAITLVATFIMYKEYFLS
ncbi:MAG: hypothetical protein R3250_11335 [Melioribacteraceae bacterium]|nr:hypothetical protein [Melioribacteraceae bacterium]